MFSRALPRLQSPLLLLLRLLCQQLLLRQRALPLPVQKAHRLQGQRCLQVLALLLVPSLFRRHLLEPHLGCCCAERLQSRMLCSVPPQLNLQLCVAQMLLHCRLSWQRVLTWRHSPLLMQPQRQSSRLRRQARLGRMPRPLQATPRKLRPLLASHLLGPLLQLRWALRLLLPVGISSTLPPPYLTLTPTPPLLSLLQLSPEQPPSALWQRSHNWLR